MKTPSLRSLFAAAFLASAASAYPASKRNYEDMTFDFIVVGAGTAGLTVAGRLAETNATVLVLEQGGDPSVDYADLPWLNPAQTGQLEGSPMDANFTSQPVKGVGWRTIRQNRGYTLGGTSSMNGMTYGRGSKVILDNWADLGNEGWDWDSMQEYFEKTWQIVPSNDTSAGRTYDPDLYQNDNNSVGYLGYNHYTPGSVQSFIDACSAINISQVEDLNNGVNEGVKHELGTFNALNQTRSSSYTMFYDRSYARDNFYSVTFATVEKILFNSPADDSEPRVTGVLYSKYDNAGVKKMIAVNAAKEVIVSAGALQSPQLLMVSGIGKKSELEEYGIDVVVDNEWVGKNLQETTSVSLIYRAFDNASTSFLGDPTQTALLAEAEQEYQANVTGPLTAWDGITGPAFAFQSLGNETLMELGAEALLNRSSASQLEWILWTSAYPNTSYPTLPTPKILDPELSYITISIYLLQPLSRGRIGLSSASMQDQPAIYLNFYDDSADMAMHILAVKKARQIAKHPAFQQWVYGEGDGEFLPGYDNVETDMQIERYIRESAVSTAHQAGTLAMRPREDMGVVSPELKVYGVQGLRVVDNSIPPVTVDQHPTGLIYAFSEKAADMIKAEYGL
ncbi:hypothetical protein JCM8547_002270 [Rhodosporidiobolus lusitaniae]